MKTTFTNCWSENLMFGLALTGLLICGNARAQIGLQDGSSSSYVTASGSTINDPFTVTPGASVLVVSLYDRNNVAGNLSPASLTWTAPGYGAQTLTRVISEEYLTSTYADSDIYYLYNPNPGAATITATDASGLQLTMQALTFNGVDTSVVPPVSVGTANGGVASLTVTLASGTPAGAWAVVNSSWASTAGYALTNSASSGTGHFQPIQNTTSQNMGYVANLNAGSSTITANDGTTTSKMTLAVVVFDPVVVPEPTSLALLGFGAVAFGLISRFRKKVS